MVKILKLLLVLLCLPLSAPGQTASLVTDIGRAGGDEESHSYPGPFMTLREQAFFSASEPATGREMWVSDGTAAGTELLADACPGGCSSDPQLLGSGGGGMFWAAETSRARLRLWWSDGTRAGTRVLQGDDLALVTPDGEHPSFVFAGGALYILGCAPGEQCGLWKSDGTEEGTRPVVPDSPWQSGSLSGLQAAGSTIFFLARDQEAPFQLGLWKTDGTEAGTVRVKSLETYPRLTGATANRFFFVSRAQDGESDELWTSDGTEAGTHVLASFPDDPSVSTEIPWLKPVGNRIYFPGNDVLNGQEIWRSDGTEAGTERVTSFGFYTPFQGRFSPWQLEELGNRVVFLATDGLSHVKLWAATGPEGRPVALAEICPDEGEGCTFIDSGWRLIKIGNRVVFRGTDAAHGGEIWSTDGTASGTRRLSDVCPGPCSAVSAEPVLSGSAAWFAMITRQGDPHLELWRTNGTETGTRRFVRLDTTWFLDELNLATAGKKIFFTAGDEYGLEPWVSDGTPEGSGMLADIAREDSGSDPAELTPLGNALVWNVCLDGFDGFLYRTGGTPETTEEIFESEWGCEQGELFAAAQKVFFVEDVQLWATDGTAGGTVQLTHFEEFGDQRVYASFAEHQGRLYFPVSNAGTTEIWRSDGTPAGTEKVLELPEEASGIYRLTSFGSELYFMTTDNLGGFQVWKSDGTSAGTRRLTEEPVSFHPSWDPQFVRLGGAVFFAGAGLWKTNGTPQGTELVSVLSRPGTGQGITDLQVFSGALYFFAWTSEGGERALWRSDGTPAGTGIVKRFVGNSDALRSHLTAYEGRLYFAADDGVHGRELWTSDGTAAGTTLVRDIRPGPEPSWPASLVAAGGKLYFRADDGLNGTELWESDGTAAGTRLRQDLSPGAPSSHPQDLTVAGSNLYFSADDGATGRELWVLPLDGPGGCQPSPTVLCLANGRFRVEAGWRDFEGRTGPGRAATLTADTGYFWFFDPENVEVVVKVLDGQGVNGHHWVFYGALSNVEYSITVTDTATGASRRYFNPTGRLGSVGHTEAFGPRGAFSRLAAGAETRPVTTEGSVKAGPCVESAERLCLNGGRFAVEAVWKDFSGNTGTGKAVRLTGDTGYFWFFDAANVEVVLKVLDGRPVNKKFWVFYGALSSVEYTITVTDTVTGQKKTYRNPSGRLASVADTGAF